MWKTLAPLALFVGSAQCVAQVSETITITGRRLLPSPFSDDMPFSGGMNVGQAVANVRDKARQIERVSDVRCSLTGSALRNVTSRNDSTDRFLASNAVFNEFKRVAPALLGSILSASRTASGQLTFLVTYADGGTEKWPVVPNYQYTSTSLFDTPMPDSLALGDGVVQPHPACGGGGSVSTDVDSESQVVPYYDDGRMYRATLVFFNGHRYDISALRNYYPSPICVGCMMP